MASLCGHQPTFRSGVQLPTMLALSHKETCRGFSKVTYQTIKSIRNSSQPQFMLRGFRINQSQLVSSFRVDPSVGPHESRTIRIEGKLIVPIVPWPCSLLNLKVPPCNTMSEITNGRPRPVPPSRPVKSGSKIRSEFAVGIPGPLSLKTTSHSCVRGRALI